MPVFIWFCFRLFLYLSWFCCIYLGDYNKPGQFIFASLCLSSHRAFFLHSSVGAGAAPLRVRTQSQPMDPFLIVFFYNDKPIHTSHNDTQRVHLLAPRTNSAVRLGLIDLGCEPALRRCCCFVLLALCEYHHVRDYVAKQNTSELGRNGIADLHEALVLGTMEWIVDGECHQPLRFFFMEEAKPAGCLDEEPAGRGVRECRCEARERFAHVSNSMRVLHGELYFPVLRKPPAQPVAGKGF